MKALIIKRTVIEGNSNYKETVKQLGILLVSQFIIMKRQLIVDFLECASTSYDCLKFTFGSIPKCSL